MFKALVDDKQLSKTQKMIYLKASVKGTAGMFFDGTMYHKAFAELTQRFRNLTLISKSLINKFLKIPAVQDENTLSLRLFVDNLHNIVRTLKTFGHEADLWAAANMQQIITKLRPKFGLRWSKRKFELQLKEVDLKDLDEWLETEVPWGMKFPVLWSRLGCEMLGDISSYRATLQSEGKQSIHSFQSQRESWKRKSQVKFKQMQVVQVARQMIPVNHSVLLFVEQHRSWQIAKLWLCGEADVMFGSDYNIALEIRRSLSG